jgi:plasmid stabilization system protein ParE
MPIKIYWTKVAQDDLRSIKSHIAIDAPATATAYIRKLKLSVNRLKDMPYSGGVVPELGREEIREVLQGNYRLIYRVRERRIDILSVFHSSRLLDDSTF